MSKTTIENFFTGKTLVIPSYQRDYAWRPRNVDDLFGDIEEALDAHSGHYLGTFILSQVNKAAPVHVVDGQQRLTTLTMLIRVLVGALDDERLRGHYSNVFIEHPVSGYKFKVLGTNEQYFRDLLDNKEVQPGTDGQDRLLAAHQRIRHRVHTLVVQHGQSGIQRWLDCISKLEVLEFIEPNEGKAIRMFQSVNDRGVSLARMDIVKSLLVYYSNRYLDARLDEHIAVSFGEAFRSFSRIKRWGSQTGYKIRQIDREGFREDDVLRYHYMAFDASPHGVTSGGDFTATSDTVLDTFLKPALTTLRNEPQRLDGFIRGYVDDLAAFFAALEALVAATRSDVDAYLLWVVQDLSATLIPLATRLHMLGWLAQPSAPGERTLMGLLAVADLRVFKLRGTNPQADIFRITRDLNRSDPVTVARDLLLFCNRFMPDHLMRARLVDEDMYRHPAVQRLLVEVEQDRRAAIGAPPLNLSSLAALVGEGLTVEHVLPQDAKNSFDIAMYGFADAAEYDLMKHRLGNLMLLEGGINSACSNHSVEAKIRQAGLYQASGLCAVQAFAADFAPQGRRFDKTHVAQRSEAMAHMAVQRWPV